MELAVFKKLPLGGTDRRAIVGALAKDGQRVADDLFAKQRSLIRPAGTAIANDTAVLILGGSNGITRALAMQLLFGERAAVYGVHYDSEKMQIGCFHVNAMKAGAEKEGLTAAFFNADATKGETISTVIASLKERFRAVHLVNGIAAGATKRYAEHGPTLVKDVDVAFDPVLQTPDFSKPENIRQLGMVDVEVANEAEIERTNRFMGSSTLMWVEPLAEAGLLSPGESVISFCDYDFPPDDPVYAMGPLAGAKRLQRESLVQIRERLSVKTARLCYPPVATTALGAIPGGLLMFGLSAQILKERGQFKDLIALGFESMDMFKADFQGFDIPLDKEYQAILPEFHKRKDGLSPSDLPAAFGLLYGD